MDLAEFRNEKMRKAKTRTTVIIVALVFVLSVIGFFYITSNFFSLKQIEVFGSTHYLSEDFSAELGLNDKSNLFYLKTEDLSAEIINRFPYVEKVTVEKQLPDTLKLYVTEAEDTFFIQTDETIYLLSKEMKVLRILPSVPKNLTELLYSAENKQTLSSPFRFNKKLDKQIFFDVLNSFKESLLLEKLTKIDYRDKFDIVVEYDGRISVWFGSYEEMNLKANKAVAIIKNLEEERGDTVKGYLYFNASGENFDPIY